MFLKAKNQQGNLLVWRFLADSNRCTWCCRPLPSHSAKEPFGCANIAFYLILKNYFRKYLVKALLYTFPAAEKLLDKTLFHLYTYSIHLALHGRISFGKFYAYVSKSFKFLS